MKTLVSSKFLFETKKSQKSKGPKNQKKSSKTETPYFCSFYVFWKVTIFWLLT